MDPVGRCKSMDFMKTGGLVTYDILLPVLFSAGNKVFGLPGKIQSAGYTKHTKKIHHPGSHQHAFKTPLRNAVFFCVPCIAACEKPRRKGCAKA
jgi:hypothetical protein